MNGLKLRSKRVKPSTVKIANQQILKSDKKTVPLRVSNNTLNIAKAYGKGYTAFVARLLDEAIKDENLVKKCI